MGAGPLPVGGGPTFRDRVRRERLMGDEADATLLEDFLRKRGPRGEAVITRWLRMRRHRAAASRRAPSLCAQKEECEGR